MDLKEQLSNKIRQAFPDFVFSNTRVITHGWNDIVLIVDESIVFTFPKDMDDSREQLKKELQLLPVIKNYVDLPVPVFTFLAPDKSFAGYKMIPGEPLLPAIFETFNPDEQTAAATMVGRFLKGLHSVPINSARDCGVQEAWSAAEASAWLKDRMETINQATNSNQERQKVEELLQIVLNRSTTTDRVLTHNDLSPDHILFDENLKSVTGIIDFGDTQFDDPAVDFRELWELGEDFVDHALAAYGTRDPNFKLRSKEHFIHCSLANMYYGIKQQNANYLARGRRVLKGF